MSSPSLEDGYKFWHDEVTADAKPEKFVPYIAVIALVGVYTTFVTEPTRLTSFDWRRSVLANDDARTGFCKSLDSSMRYRMDEDQDYETSLDYLKPEEEAHAHNWLVYDSIVDGVPDGTETVVGYEEFLAETLGHAVHDQNIFLRPLVLIDGGWVALRNHYPQTADFLQEHSS